MADMSNMGTTIAAGGSAFIGGALFKIIKRVIVTNWPNFLDPDTADAIDDLCTAGVAMIAVKITHNQLAKTAT